MCVFLVKDKGNIDVIIGGVVGLVVGFVLIIVIIVVVVCMWIRQDLDFINFLIFIYIYFYKCMIKI